MVLANRPHVACPQPMVVLEKNVILTKADHTGEQSLTHLMHMERGGA